MRSSLIGLWFVALLSLAACSGTAELDTDRSEPAAELAERPDQTTGPARDPDTGPDDEQAVDDPAAGRDVPPLVLPPGGPGSDEAYDALIADLDRFVTDEQRAAGIPWPDLRNPDPIAAYRSCAEFQGWMAENNPTPLLVEAYTAPFSPERDFDLELFATMSINDVVATPSVPPYVMDVRGVVHPAATDITDALLAEVPEGSAAVVYYDSVGSRRLVRPDGSVWRTQDGWVDDGPWVAIMAPTDVGWQVWWDELTDTPPPGLDDDRGLPATPPPRADL